MQETRPRPGFFFRCATSNGTKAPPITSTGRGTDITVSASSSLCEQALLVSQWPQSNVQCVTVIADLQCVLALDARSRGDNMKTHKTRDRVEQTLRWMLALALIAA